MAQSMKHESTIMLYIYYYKKYVYLSHFANVLMMLIVHYHESCLCEILDKIKKMYICGHESCHVLKRETINIIMNGYTPKFVGHEKDRSGSWN